MLGRGNIELCSRHFKNFFFQAQDISPQFFCKSFERYGYVVHEPLKYIEAHADPARSDFEFSDERWEFYEEAEGTVVIYAFRMKPDFFIPPLIGPAILKAKLKNGGAHAIERIEALARDYAPYGD